LHWPPFARAGAIQSRARWWARSASSPPPTPMSWCRHPRPHGGDPTAYDRWLANIEPNPRDLLVPFPAEPMLMWPISTRVNKPTMMTPRSWSRLPGSRKHPEPPVSDDNLHSSSYGEANGDDSVCSIPCSRGTGRRRGSFDAKPVEPRAPKPVASPSRPSGPRAIRGCSFFTPAGSTKPRSTFTPAFRTPCGSWSVCSQ
jgi:hypothetical protein